MCHDTAKTRPALRERRSNRFAERAWTEFAFDWRWSEDDLIVPDFALAADVEEYVDTAETYPEEICMCCCCTGECAVG